MTILCCGDRNWEDTIKIQCAILEYPTITKLIHGNANGADRIAAYIAIRLEISTESFPAKWSQYGKAAGPIRNQQMLDEGKPDLVLAFHCDIRSSKGTKDMINRAHKANIPVRIFK